MLGMDFYFAPGSSVQMNTLLKTRLSEGVVLLEEVRSESTLKLFFKDGE